MYLLFLASIFYALGTIFLFFCLCNINWEAGIARSVQRLAADWTAEGSDFVSWYGLGPPLHVIQTGSVAHPALGLFLRGKSAGA
jgi:hypothetical protein